MELLDEIWNLIFSQHLDLIDVIRCRRVSKRFKFLIDQLRPTELFVYGHDPCPGYLRRADKEPSNWIQLFRFYFELNSSFMIVFANLKFLELDIDLSYHYKKDKLFNLELLNEFTQLEKLYANAVVIEKTQTIRLPKLVIFSARLYSKREYADSAANWHKINYRFQPRLVLDSKVKKLYCRRSTILVVKHPECIEFFECSFEAMEQSQTMQFKNLRVLRSQLKESVVNIFEKFEFLEELYLDRCERSDEIWFDRLLAKRSDLGRNVKIFISEICLPFEEPLVMTARDFREEELELRIRNYHRLVDCVRGISEVWFGNVLYCLDYLPPNQIELDKWQFPIDFFRKFLNIQIVRATSRIQNEDQFIWFLSRCARLTKLFFDREFLTQTLINRLPSGCKPLKILHISSDCGRGLDLRPVYGLKQLFRLEIFSRDANLDSPLDLVELFESCRYLVAVKLSHIRIIKSELYFVETPAEKDLTKNGYVSLVSQGRAGFSYADLKLNLNTILEECKEMRKRSSSHSIW